MVTTILPFTQSTIEQAAALIQQGEVIAFPTDTVYGLGCDVYNRQALQRIYQIKERPHHMPLPILLADVQDLALVARKVSPLAEAIGNISWPGALTLVLPAQAVLPGSLDPQATTVAVRIPDHDLLRACIRACGRPITGTSANLHGLPSPTTAKQVQAQLDQRIPLIFDGGTSESDHASTIIDLSEQIPRIIRAGAFDLQRLSHLLPPQLLKQSRKP